jgi:hypothetical protein
VVFVCTDICVVVDYVVGCWLWYVFVSLLSLLSFVVYRVIVVVVASVVLVHGSTVVAMFGFSDHCLVVVAVLAHVMCICLIRMVVLCGCL